MLVTDFQNSPLITARYLVFKHTSERRGRPATLISTVASATPVLNTTSERRGRAIPSKSDNKVAEFFFFILAWKPKVSAKAILSNFSYFFTGTFGFSHPLFYAFFTFFTPFFTLRNLVPRPLFFEIFTGEIGFLHLQYWACWKFKNLPA